MTASGDRTPDSSFASLSRRVHALLHTRGGAPRLFVPGVVVVAITFVLALAFGYLASGARRADDRAAALLKSGKAAQAEVIYARLVREGPTVERALALLEAHETARVKKRVSDALSDARDKGMGLPDAEPSLPEEDIDAIVSGLPPDVALIARFARGVSQGAVPDEVREEVVHGAAAEPPVPWTNHVLAYEMVRAGNQIVAAPLLLREGISFPERASDVEAALSIWMSLESWDEIDEQMADPRVRAAASPWQRYRWALARQDYREIFRVSPAIWLPKSTPGAWMMTATTALAWALFCARLGKAGGRPKVRLPLYVTAFALGVVSVLPTLWLVAIEESKLHLVETGDTARDLLFFVFGVGLREEACKLLLFLPLLPLLRRYGDKLDVLVCGALVGLGFAAEENLLYLAREDLHTGLTRFLTANFFHMAMTGTLASALDDFVRDRERYASDFTRATLLVVGLHGAYDFLLSHEELGGGYLAMTVFVVLTRMFLGAVDVARRRADRGLSPLHTFIVAVAVVTGVSLAHAYSAVGPAGAALVLAEGLVGQGIIVFVFVRTLRTL